MLCHFGKKRGPKDLPIYVLPKEHPRLKPKEIFKISHPEILRTRLWDYSVLQLIATATSDCPNELRKRLFGCSTCRGKDHSPAILLKLLQSTTFQKQKTRDCRGKKKCFSLAGGYFRDVLSGFFPVAKKHRPKVVAYFPGPPNAIDDIVTPQCHKSFAKLLGVSLSKINHTELHHRHFWG